MEKLNWSTVQRTVNELIPLEINPRKISEDKRMKMIESLQRFNLVDIPVIDMDNTVISGHQRLRALQSIGRGDETIDVRFPSRKLSDKELKEYNLLANTHYGEFDIEMFEEFFSDIEIDIIPIDMDKIVFEQSDAFETIQKKYEKEVEREAQKLEAKEDDFDVPEGGSETDIVLGDLFEIGEHRLLCGDSTSTDAVQMLMGGGIADMVFTDPPYNVAFNGRSGKFDVIENDNLSNKDFENFINEFANTLHTLNIPIKYIWCNWKFYDILKCKFNFNACIVWAKNQFGMGNGYRHQHEFCLFEGNIDQGINNESDLWNGISRALNYEHPTQKPVELASRAFNNHKLAINILDLFGGSGMSMIAAHQLKRKMFMMELDPKYCQVIVNRMRKLDPELIIKRNGEII